MRKKKSTAPKILVIARPQLAGDAIREFFLEHELDWKVWKSQAASRNTAELLTEFAGRICYLSFKKPGKRGSPRTTPKYIQNLIDQGHESVFEHATWTFVCYGISRAFSHQFVRHRIGFGFSQLSQQYHDHGDANFVLPYGVDENPDLHADWDDHNRATMDLYRKMLELENSVLARKIGKKEARRLSRSTARSILPNSTETKLVFSANARALRHFLLVRGAVLGDLEMRQFCVELMKIMRREAPNLFADFKITKHRDGHPYVAHQVPRTRKK